jgi:pyridinium-3,5-bisthiocarboxylic acid mononucleotide nickel chelatase
MCVLYFDCFSGASGDMIVGSLLDMGLPLEQLGAELQKLNLPNYSISADKVVKAGIAATKFNVQIGHEHAHRNYSAIEKIINGSLLNDHIKESATKVFLRLAEAEARVHGSTVDQIHFHEVGAIDAIIDIVGACIGFQLLGVEEIAVSPLNVGTGFIQSAHGRLPVPAPATVELLKGIPIYSNQTEGELVTPTGAAILSTLGKKFVPLVSIEIETIGYGAGTRDTPGTANVLRVLKGKFSSQSTLADGFRGEQKVTVIEANIDDMNPQLYGYLHDRLMTMGALDAYVCPVQMKKNRPGLLLTVVISPETLDTVTDAIFRETTTIGIRYYEAGRRVLERQIIPIEFEYGTIRVKVSKQMSQIVNFSPEYEDCRIAADKHKVPVKLIQARVTQEFMNRFGKELLKLRCEGDK